MGTCRLLIDGAVARLGRMAVSPRAARPGRGRAAPGRGGPRGPKAHGARIIRLHAQVAARGVYDRAGYHPVSGVFVEEGIEHVTMEKFVA